MELEPHKCLQETVSTFVERMTISDISVLVKVEMVHTLLSTICSRGPMGIKYNTTLALVLFLKAKKRNKAKKE